MSKNQYTCGACAIPIVDGDFVLLSTNPLMKIYHHVPRVVRQDGERFEDCASTAPRNPHFFEGVFYEGRIYGFETLACLPDAHDIKVHRAPAPFRARVLNSLEALENTEALWRLDETQRVYVPAEESEQARSMIIRL